MSSIRYRLRTEDLAWRVLDGEGVLVDLAQQRIMTCNGSATAVVAALLDGATEAELVRTLCAAYDVEEERAGTDVRGLLEQLPVVPAAGLSPRGATRSDDPAGDVRAPGAREAYERPAVDADALFYAAAGCGKVSPRTTNCLKVKKNS